MKTKSLYLLSFLLLASMLAACSAPTLAPAPTALPSPTPVPASNLTAVDPAAISQGFWDAINAKDVDAAMAFVADDVVTSGGPVFFSNRAEFSAFMVSEQEKGNTFEISDLKILSEDTVTYTMKIYANGIMFVGSSGLKLQVRDGKIVLMEFPA